jgi:hypothetical protein
MYISKVEVKVETLGSSSVAGDRVLCGATTCFTVITNEKNYIN